MLISFPGTSASALRYRTSHNMSWPKEETLPIQTTLAFTLLIGLLTMGHHGFLAVVASLIQYCFIIQPTIKYNQINMSYYPTIKRTRIEIGQRCTETGCEGCGNHDEPTISPFDLTAFNSNNNNTLGVFVTCAYNSFLVGTSCLMFVYLGPWTYLWS